MALAGLLGACGVATAAMASHAEGMRNLMAISAMALAHAPVLLAIALAGKGRVLVGAGLLMGLACVLFVGDLAMRQWQGVALFPGAAPIGGGALIVSWLTVAIASLLST